MKPILFNTAMVQAILEGRKTTTRRIIKNVEQFGTALATTKGIFSKKGLADHGPYKIGDILYVRETWCKLYKLDNFERIIEGTDKFYYRADGYNPTPFNCFPDENGFNGERDCPRWRPSIHMPKEAARIFLKVTDVRVERLQDIDNEGAKAEGIRKLSTELYGVNEKTDIVEQCLYPRGSFKFLWDSTLKKDQIEKYGWKANPWVWVIEFERCEKPNEG